LDYIEPFDIEIHNRNDDAHQNDDALSHCPCETKGHCLQKVEVGQTAEEVNQEQCLQISSNNEGMRHSSPLLVWEDDRHNQMCQDPNRPHWQGDRSLCAADQPRGPNVCGIRSISPGGQQEVECQIMAVKTWQHKCAEQQEAVEHQEVEQYSNRSENTALLLVREDDRCKLSKRGSDWPL